MVYIYIELKLKYLLAITKLKEGYYRTVAYYIVIFNIGCLNFKLDK